MATRAFIGHVLGECFEARAFLVMDPQVAFGAPDGWPTYSRTAHSTWELAGILQDIQPEPRSHELCYSHVSSPSFHALTRSTHSSREVAMITRSSAKNSSHGTPTLKSLDKASSTMIKSRGLLLNKNFTFTWGQFRPSGIVTAYICLSVCVCLCVHQSPACLCDDLWPIWARITKFEPEVQNCLIKVPIVLGVDGPWASRSNLTYKSKFHYALLIHHSDYTIIRVIHDSHESFIYLDCFTVPTVSWSLSYTPTYLPRPLYRPDCFTVSTPCTYTVLGSWENFGV